MDAEPENSTIEVEPEPLNPPARKALLFLVLAAVWIFPSIGALFIIGNDWARWFRAPSLNQALLSIAFEEWIALALLLLQICFAAAAIHYRVHKISESTN